MNPLLEAVLVLPCGSSDALKWLLRLLLTTHDPNILEL